jgi:dipeptidyl-peptidase-4
LRFRRAAAVVAAALASAGLAAARPPHKPVTLEVVDRAPALGSTGVSEVHWVPQSDRVSYLKPARVDAAGPLDLWIEEVPSGNKRILLRGESLLAAGAKDVPGPLSGYRWSPDGARVLFTRDDNLWIASAETGQAAPLTRGTEAKELPGFSPDGHRVAYVQNNDLYCVEVASGQTRRLTFDGGDDVFNGRLDWVYEEELANRGGRAYVWSPDSRSLAYVRLDDTRVPAYPILDYGPNLPKLHPQHYPRPGDPNPVPAVRIVGIDGRTKARADFSGQDVYVLPDLAWTPDSLGVAFGILDRQQTRLDWRLLEAVSGRTRRIFSESDPHWLNVSNFEAGPPLLTLPRFLGEGTHFLWISEHTGFAHLYRGDLATGRLQPLTSGPWMVDLLCGIDEAGGWIYFLSTRGDARRREIDRVRFDGSGFQKISREEGTHRAELSPDGRYYLDEFSTVADPPAVRLHRSDGEPVRVLAGPSRDAEEYDLARTQWVDLAASDGTVLHARLVEPADFDASRRYPVVVDVYGGPSVQQIRDRWGTTTALDHLLAGNGFLVWELDNRGSWGRGHAFETPIFEDLGRVELEDQLEGVRYLKSLPYVDGSRLAVAGWSYGGFMTLYAAAHAPEVWKCAVAGAPVTDWSLYDSIYTERYMRTPDSNPSGYERTSPAGAASRIRAKLLLVHGTSDDNVHLQNTIRMIDGLTGADVDYELEVLPGQLHGVRGRAAVHYRNRRFLEFLKKNL